MARNSRLYSLDFLKFVAALMITNSHFQPLYEDVSPSLATFGVHGNALFFFVSGFLLMMGFEKKKSHGFLNWYKGRMRRLWPAVFIWVVVSAAVWKQTLTIGNLLLLVLASYCRGIHCFLCLDKTYEVILGWQD